MSRISINVIALPAFRDNYLWLFHRPGDTAAYVVDPGDARPVEAGLAENGLSLAGILITHHHPDHIGGVDQLLDNWKVPVYGPAGGSVPQVTEPVGDGDSITLDHDLSFSVLSVPGHTLDHIAYYHEQKVHEQRTHEQRAHEPTACEHTDPPTLFCGDTLFAGGCGRLFEGTPEQMYQSLGKLSRLPDPTRVYCAHEYTMANLAFAKAVEGDNPSLLERIKNEQAKRDRRQATVPSTIVLEKSTNPFLRCHQPSVKSAAEMHCSHSLESPQAVLAVVREWKDNF